MNRLLVLFVMLTSCNHFVKPGWPKRQSSAGGSTFYTMAAAMQWRERDSLVTKEVLSGNVPDFLKRFVPVRVSIYDTISRETISATYYVAPDYLSVGNNDDWARVNITPLAAQRIADSLQCFLPTRKIVDDIYRQAAVKLEPVPMYAYRDSTPTMWHHHLIIEGQRKGKRGLIAGIKKDVVISGKISRDNRPNRVAIYGWHQPDGKPIQPLYTGHVFWWVDYSQGIRLVYQKIKVNRQWMNYKEVLQDNVLKRLLCDEEVCDFYRYNY